MINPPKTLEEAKKLDYGGSYRLKYKTGLCAYSVWGGWNSHQCLRKNGYGPSGLYCKQHAKKVEKL